VRDIFTTHDLYVSFLVNIYLVKLTLARLKSMAFNGEFSMNVFANLPLVAKHSSELYTQA